MGYVAMRAKDLSRGKELRDTGKLETWASAAMQSGGLGIVGDFSLGKADRFGNQAVASMAGPTITELSKITPIVGQMLRGEAQSAGEDALRLALGNTPFINLWYTRAALGYALLYHIREALSPGTLARTESRMRQDFNQRYLRIGDLDLTPSKVIRRGGGFK